MEGGWKEGVCWMNNCVFGWKVGVFRMVIVMCLVVFSK